MILEVHDELISRGFSLSLYETVVASFQGYTVFLPTSESKAKACHVCVACARALRGRYKLKKIEPGSLDFACSFGEGNLLFLFFDHGPKTTDHEPRKMSVKDSLDKAYHQLIVLCSPEESNFARTGIEDSTCQGIPRIFQPRSLKKGLLSAF